MLTCISLLTFANELCVSISIIIVQGSYGKIILWMLMSHVVVCLCSVRGEPAHLVCSSRA